MYMVSLDMYNSVAEILKLFLAAVLVFFSLFCESLLLTQWILL